MDTDIVLIESIHYLYYRLVRTVLAVYVLRSVLGGTLEGIGFLYYLYFSGTVYSIKWGGKLLVVNWSANNSSALHQ